MKKIIYLISMYIVILIVSICFFDKKEIKDIKPDNKLSSNVNIISKEKENKTKTKEDNKELYVSNVPYINQEYTIEEEVIENNIVSEEEQIVEEELVTEETKNIEEEPIIEDNNVVEETEEDTTEIQESEIEESEEGILTEESENNDITLKNGFVEEDGKTYYYENDKKVTGLKVIDSVKHYFSPSGVYLGTTNVKVIDVSYYQKDINWDLFYSDSDCYGVILRLGYYDTLDKKFERNLSELKRLNIPYGIYLFSYATNIEEARHEASFTNQMIDKYDIKPELGIYYDLESWKTNSFNSDGISKNGYNYIAKGYIESVSNHVNNNYIIGIYSGRWYAMNRLGNIAKEYVKWVAEYNNTLKYDGPYLMWQYTSKGNVPGIEGNVDISYLQ